jgi:hypothetical protein
MKNIFKSNYARHEKNEKNEEKKYLDLSLEHFPVLSKPIIQQKNLDGFLDKIKIEKIKTEDKIDNFKNIQPGWLLIKREKNGRISKRYGPNKKQIQVDDYDDNFKVLKALSNLHEKRTDEYIDNWGYDEWEAMFISPYHDHYYFDRLDEEEEEKMREQEQKLYEENDEYITDRNKFEKYWEQY